MAARRQSNPKSPERTLKAEDLKVGDYVLLTKERAGLIKWIGDVHYDEGKHFGVELIGSLGKHSGTWRGKKYFECAEMRGMLVKMDRVRKKLTKRDIEEDKEGMFAKMGLSKRNLGIEEEKKPEGKKENQLLLDAQEWEGKDVRIYVNKQLAQDGEKFADLTGVQFLELYQQPQELKKRTRNFKKLLKFMKADFFPDEEEKKENKTETPKEESGPQKDEGKQEEKVDAKSEKLLKISYKEKRAQKKDRVSVDLGKLKLTGK